MIIYKDDIFKVNIRKSLPSNVTNVVEAKRPSRSTSAPVVLWLSWLEPYVGVPPPSVIIPPSRDARCLPPAMWWALQGPLGAAVVNHRSQLHSWIKWRTSRLLWDVSNWFCRVTNTLVSLFYGVRSSCGDFLQLVSSHTHDTSTVFMNLLHTCCDPFHVNLRFVSTKLRFGVPVFAEAEVWWTMYQQCEQWCNKDFIFVHPNFFDWKMLRLGTWNFKWNYNQRTARLSTCAQKHKLTSIHIRFD